MLEGYEITNDMRITFHINTHKRSDMTKRIFLSLYEAVTMMVDDPSLVARLRSWHEYAYISYHPDDPVLRDESLNPYIPLVNHILENEWEVMKYPDDTKLENVIARLKEIARKEEVDLMAMTHLEKSKWIEDHLTWEGKDGQIS